MLTNWKSNEVIRNKQTGKPYLVLHVYKHVCTIVVDLNQSGVNTPLVLLERDYADYASDRDMKQKVTEEYNTIQEEWSYA